MIRSMLRRLTAGRWPAVSAGEALHCSDVGRVLQAYLDGEVVDDDAVAAIGAHLDDCRRCGLEADTYEAIRTSLRARRPQLDEAAVSRLRSFGARLADGTH